MNLIYLDLPFLSRHICKKNQKGEFCKEYMAYVQLG